VGFLGLLGTKLQPKRFFWCGCELELTFIFFAAFERAKAQVVTLLTAPSSQSTHPTALAAFG